jgi:hypothetical protein
MRISSRHMPKFDPEPLSRWAWVVLAALAAGLLYAVVSAPKAAAVGVGVLLALSIWAHVDLKRHRQRLTQLAAGREGQSICEFARDFETRKVDTWIIRAVYEHLQEQLTYAHPAFPIRAAHRLKEDLQLDPDDVDLDVLVQVEQRTGRSLDQTRDNPYYGRVQTAGDLVLFFQAQPRLSERPGG